MVRYQVPDDRFDGLLHSELEGLGGVIRPAVLKAFVTRQVMPNGFLPPALGDLWALDQLWKELGFDALAGVFRKARYTTPVEHAIRVMVFNRLCDADSNLGVLRWLQTVSMPPRSMCRLCASAFAALPGCADGPSRGRRRFGGQSAAPLVDQDLSLVFYDLTTIRAAGLSQQTGDVRQHGMTKEV